MVGPPGPVPVWLVAGVATLVTEGGFEELDKVPMPSEEETGGVDQWGVDDVCRFEVVESRTGARGLGGIDFGRLGV